MSPPADLIAVIGHADYAINPAGEVWRLHCARANSRYPVPRRLEPVWLGGKGTAHSAHFRFDTGTGSKNVATRSLAQLMAGHFPKGRG